MKSPLLFVLASLTAGLSGCGGGETASSAAVADAAYARIAVKGMHCEMCASSVKGFLKKVDGVVAVHVDVPSGTVLAKLAPGKNPDDAVLKKAVFDAGFEATGITRSADGYDKAVAAFAKK